jgi:hypothetical protein
MELTSGRVKQQMMNESAGSNFPAERLKHLEFLQATIVRLGNSSFLVKGWCVTVFAALLAVAVNLSNWKAAMIALLPVLGFWILDSRFLHFERAYRRLYDEARLIDTQVEIFSMDITLYLRGAKSRSTALSSTLSTFYGLLALIGITIALLLGLDK